MEVPIDWGFFFVYFFYMYNNRYDRCSNFIKLKKYHKLLENFIKTIYPKIEFNIFVKKRDVVLNTLGTDNWFLDLNFYEIMPYPLHHPFSFDPEYCTTYGEYINEHQIYNEIESFIPELNKCTSVSFYSSNKTFLQKPFLKSPLWEIYSNKQRIINGRYKIKHL